MAFLGRFIVALITRTIVAGALLGIGVAGYVGINYVNEEGLRRGQAEAIDKYGTTAVNLCQKKFPRREEIALAAKPKIAIIDSDRKVILSNYLEALDAEMSAQSAAEVNTVLCAREKEIKFNTDTYTSSGSTRRYYCTQYAHDLEVFLVDLKSGKVVAYNSIEGGSPAECPASTSSDLRRDGDPPTAADLAKWLKLVVS